MAVRRGQTWGTPGSLPADGVVVRSDAEARAVVTAARREGRPAPALGLLGGDLCRTLGGRGDEARLRSPAAVTMTCDLATVLVDGRLHVFVAHLVARRRAWRGRIVVAMNAAWLGPWNLGPRAHPGDGVLDVYEARLPLRQAMAVRSRLPLGAHLPHPAIVERRTKALHVELDAGTRLQLDGEALGPVRNLLLRVEPDALTVVV
ncbi:MAG: hypothetical protein KY450_05205 [Actinobacteria bacterium]|nr:hypothetical protein [Actinomycetota bacterium]